MTMKKLMAIDYSVDVASGSYGIVNIQNVLGIILLILSILSIIIKGVMAIYIHIKNKEYKEIENDINKMVDDIEKIKKDGDSHV